MNKLHDRFTLPVTAIGKQIAISRVLDCIAPSVVVDDSDANSEDDPFVSDLEGASSSSRKPKRRPQSSGVSGIMWSTVSEDQKPGASLRLHISCHV